LPGLLTKLKKEKSEADQKKVGESAKTEGLKSVEEEERMFIPTTIYDNFQDMPALQETWKLPGLDTVYYLPNFVDETEAASLKKWIYSEKNKPTWINLTHSRRRLQRWGGEVKGDG
jgi:hypothetical protein